MPGTPAHLLPDVIDAAYQAGAMLEAEFVRPDGPRFSDHVTCPVDHEMEMYLRDRLVALFPARFVGEEAGVLAAEANGYCWVVDPHDGTRAFLEGRRGSAVSVALLRDGIPVLGVVYAPLSPDRGPDMISWAEGTPGIVRNGVLVPIDLRERRLTATDVVFLNHGVWQRPVWNGLAVAPGRFMPLPSIAYRLARVAVGDGLATVTLRPVNAHDVAAGHALLLAAGGVLTAEDGAPVVYDDQGQSRPSACFGGAPLVVEYLRGRQWRGSTEARRDQRVVLNWPRAVPEAIVDRAVGCLMGMAVGNALGGLVEGMSAEAIARAYPSGLRDLHDGGVHGALAGQLTPAGEAAILLARTALAEGVLPATDRARDHAGLVTTLRTAMTGAMLVAADGMALGRAFEHLAAGTSLEDAVIQTVAQGGDTAVNAAIVGAVLGAVQGRAAVPVRWAMPVLTCRPDAACQAAGLPISDARPEQHWADDVTDLAEALLLRLQTHM